MSEQQTEILDKLKNLDIRMPEYKNLDDLKEAACQYQNLLWKRTDHKDWSIHDDKEVVDDITVNYLRFSCYYGDMIHLLYKKMGKVDVNDLMFDKVLKVISSRYPHLADECEIQRKSRREGMKNDKK